jgi:hypothetical protein
VNPIEGTANVVCREVPGRNTLLRKSLGQSFGRIKPILEIGKQVMETSDATLTELLRADDRRYEAMIARDVSALERLLADELLYTQSTGHTDTKKQYLETINSGYVLYRSSQIDDLTFRTRGEIGMLMGRARIEATIAGVDRVLENRFFASWVKDDGQWKLLAWVSIPSPR